MFYLLFLNLKLTVFSFPFLLFLEGVGCWCSIIILNLKFSRMTENFSGKQTTNVRKIIHWNVFCSSQPYNRKTADFEKMRSSQKKRNFYLQITQRSWTWLVLFVLVTMVDFITLETSLKSRVCRDYGFGKSVTAFLVLF